MRRSLRDGRGVLADCQNWRRPALSRGLGEAYLYTLLRWESNGWEGLTMPVREGVGERKAFGSDWISGLGVGGICSPCSARDGLEAELGMGRKGLDINHFVSRQPRQTIYCLFTLLLPLPPTFILRTGYGTGHERMTSFKEVGYILRGGTPSSNWTSSSPRMQSITLEGYHIMQLASDMSIRQEQLRNETEPERPAKTTRSPTLPCADCGFLFGPGA